MKKSAHPQIRTFAHFLNLQFTVQIPHFAGKIMLSVINALVGLSRFLSLL
jgi:hypothetical protein